MLSFKIELIEMFVKQTELMYADAMSDAKKVPVFVKINAADSAFIRLASVMARQEESALKQQRRLKAALESALKEVEACRTKLGDPECDLKAADVTLLAELGFNRLTTILNVCTVCEKFCYARRHKHEEEIYVGSVCFC
uniref:GST C-terminal domain-containing protein n=1 Tax=Panagrellus redivivus TaxID=6233 RepID=A0A7E4ZSL6_PANRE